jgi:AraC-like DNA-binding protein
MTGEEKLLWFKRILIEGSVDDQIIMILQIFHVFTYMFIVNKLLKAHVDKICNSFSSIEKINLNWLRRNMFMFLGVFGVMIILHILNITGFEKFVSQYANDIIALSVTICIYTAGYMGLRQPEIFTGDTSISPTNKYEKSSLTPEQSEKYLKNLLQFMESEKPYLKNELSLRDLAELTAISVNHLSQIINEQLQQNFFDFINRYRIEEAAKRLSDQRFQHFSILGIAENVGFNSKSVFNTAFKKYKKTTPSYFRNQNIKH